MFDWNDLRFFLAIEKFGTIRAAAKELGVTHATVSRRLENLELDLKTRLFDRSIKGHVLTQAARDILSTARRIDVEMAELNRLAFGLDDNPTGIVKLSMPGFLANSIVLPHLDRFREQYPDIQLALNITTQLSRLSHHETDIALRLTRTPPELVVGRRIANSPLAVYGSADYLAQRPERDHWVAFEYEPARAMTPEKLVIARIDDLHAMTHALCSGWGLGVLPCFIGDSQPELRRLDNHKPVPDLDLWLLLHPDLRHVKRVRILYDFLVVALANDKNRIAGLHPLNTPF